MNPAVEQAVAEALPHAGRCLARRGGLCDCTANARRNVLLAKLSNQGGYVYGHRR